MRLVGSSSRVQGLRRGGEPRVVGRVGRLVASGEAAWCPAIRLEPRNGVGGETDRRLLREHREDAPGAAHHRRDLAGRRRKAEKTAPAIDVLIAACARHDGVELEHDDSHFDFLMTR